ncbi:MAG: adenine deaminase [Anaerolineales bacterium]|nr:adenine deaminase [Anaerolineales bacterium]
MISLSERKDLIRAALGQAPLDLRIDGVQVVNVFSGTIEPGSIGIKGGRIVTPYAADYDANVVVDGQGRFALPGFIDTHVHLDSTLVVPEFLSQLLLPRGTTVMLSDPMEIANVAGLPGFKALFHSIDKLDYHIFLEVSSRVPTAPGLETTGGELDLADVSEILTWPQAVSLGELDPSKVLEMRDEYLLKVEAALRLGKICNGHAVGRVGKELVAYACGGLADDHECVDYEEAVSRLQLGMAVLVREGSTERNLDPILKGVVENGTYSHHLMFCTDDKHPDEILEEGHIDFMVNRAIELGLTPMQAIQMATINAAKHFRIEHLVGSLSPGRWADILLVDDLQHISPNQVFFKGKIVVEDGEYIGTLPKPEYPDWLYKTVILKSGNSGSDFRLEAAGDRAEVWVIDLFPDQIINTRTQDKLRVIDGAVAPDPERDILKLAVVERHGKNGNIGVSFVKGFGLKNGALASSIAHDHHNIIVAGTNDDDMALCAKTIEEMQGGFALVSDGKVLGKLALPIAGLLTEEPVADVIVGLEDINQAYHDLGGSLPAPFMTISFIGLPTVPDLGLTDMGLIDVFSHKLISSFVE